MEQFKKSEKKFLQNLMRNYLFYYFQKKFNIIEKEMTKICKRF